MKFVELCRSEWTKAAAISAATVVAIDPLRPNGPANDPLWPLVNPMFAMTCAYGYTRNMFGYKTFDEKHRVYRALRGIKLPSLIPLIQEGEANKGIFKSDWKLTLSYEELSIIDILIAYFVLLQENEQLLLRVGARKG